MYFLVEKLVDEMIEFNIVEQCQKEEYVYSILCIAESIIWFVTIICIGIFFHILWETVGYLAFLYILRRRTGSERNVVVRMNLREKRTVVSYLTDNKYICNLAKKIYFLHITLYFWHIPKYIVCL